jgi:hypothetical protein
VVIAVVVLAHLVGGASLVHTGLFAPLVAHGPVLLGLLALVAVKLTVLVGARRWWR